MPFWFSSGTQKEETPTSADTAANDNINYTRYLVLVNYGTALNLPWKNTGT